MARGLTPLVVLAIRANREKESTMTNRKPAKRLIVDSAISGVSADEINSVLPWQPKRRPYQPTQEEHDDEMTAVHEGRASELMECPADGTLQGIVKVWDQPSHFPDPSTVYTLRCGHKVI